ncbi:MAG: alpha/beta hydrolase [Thermoanaerobaculia bacterium]
MSLRPWAEATKDLPPGRLLDVAGREVGIERAGSGAPLVLLHGFGESTLAVEKVIPDLARHFDVVAIDLNGFGYTQRPRERASYTLAGQAQLVLDVMDRLGFEKVTLGGHSYGGGVALYLAAEHPERIQRLLLVDNVLPIFATKRRAPFFAWRWVVNLVVHTIGLRDKRIEEGLLESYYDDALVTPALIREYADRLRIEGAVDAYRGLMGPTKELPYELDLATIRQPTLVVWGAEDALIPAAGARETSAALPDGRFVEIPACGHNPMDECPKQFLDAALPFLTGR